MATILIVDDEEPVRDVLVQMLTDAGHRILKAVHGADALAVIERERPDLVVTDMMMPVLTGVELCPAPEGHHRHRGHPSDSDELHGAP